MRPVAEAVSSALATQACVSGCARSRRIRGARRASCAGPLTNNRRRVSGARSKLWGERRRPTRAPNHLPARALSRRTRRLHVPAASFHGPRAGERPPDVPSGLGRTPPPKEARSRLRTPHSGWSRAADRQVVASSAQGQTLTGVPPPDSD
ncbi:hypothetical protein MRX96_015063 [Rhipicephalus microplus]